MFNAFSGYIKFAASLALGGAASLAVYIGLQGQPTPAFVSFTFDDASTSQYSIAFQLSQKYGLPGTLFVPTQMVSRGKGHAADDWSMNWDNIREMSRAGWEIGSHSQTHPRLTGLPPEEITAELDGSRRKITAETGIVPVSFSSPFGDFNDETIARIMESYTYHVSWKGHGGRMPTVNIDNRYIGRLEVTNEMTVTQVCGEMVQAARKNLWLVLLFHTIVEGEAGEYEVSAEMVEGIYACANFLENKGVIDVAPVRDAAEALEKRY